MLNINGDIIFKTQFIEIQIIVKLNYISIKNKIVMINDLPYETLFNICIFIDRQEDLYDFLEAIGKDEYYEKISKNIFLYYIEKLKKYYNHIKSKKEYIKHKNEEDEIDFYLNFYLHDMINNNINFNYYDNDNGYDTYEDVPYDNTNSFTCLCSEMIKEYNITNSKILNDKSFILTINTFLNL